MEDISFARFTPQADVYITAQLIECYRDVFAEDPWNEWLQCPKCKTYWGKKDEGTLVTVGFKHCDTGLVDFWSRDQVAHDLNHEINHESSCWLALHGEKVIGFCWGYPITAEKLQKKLQDRRDLEKKLTDTYDPVELMAHQDEVGVLSEFRKRGIAKELVLRRLDDFISQGLRTGVVRTRKTPQPSVTYLWYTQKLGYSEVATYPDDDGRVVLGRKLSSLREILST